MRKILKNPVIIAPLCIFGFIFFHLMLFLAQKVGPEIVAETCAKIQGFSFTPFFMEAGFVVFGLTCVLLINFFRTRWDGDEMVSIEIKDETTQSLLSQDKE